MMTEGLTAASSARPYTLSNCGPSIRAAPLCFRALDEAVESESRIAAVGMGVCANRGPN